MTRATAAVASQRFRQRKLSTKHALQVIHENELDPVEPDQQNTQKVETGVEKHEETEHHLQAAISASQAAAIGGKVSQIYIPTPETAQSKVSYSEYYPLKYSLPATYVRFSSTVEDCSGCPYNLSEEDDAFFKEFNQKLKQTKNAATQCTEDQFEEAMYFFEETTKSQQPFSSVGDPPPVLPYEEMENAFDENIDEPARTYAKDIYEHWKSRRVTNGNTPLQPGLKLKVIETGNDADDNDPYVCFRRREVRQARKTRGRDAQSVEKLKRLRRELEDARALVAMIRQRELTKREQLTVDKLLFQQRANLRGVKRQLPEQYQIGDEDLLINQKKKKPLEVNTGLQRTPTNAQLRFPSRPDGRASDADLVSIQEVLADKESEIEREIKMKIHQHQKWNENYVDMTRAPLTPTGEDNFTFNFRSAVTAYLPTPPASVSSEHSGDAVADESSPSRKQVGPSVVSYVLPPNDGPNHSQPSFRRRIGRGGRMMIDRRGMHLQPGENLNPLAVDRFRFDQDDDDEDENPTYLVDQYDISNMRYRAAIAGSHQPHSQAQAQAVKRQIEAAAAAQNAASVASAQKNSAAD